MRIATLTVALALTLAAVASNADLEGSVVVLVSPEGVIDPGETYDYVLRLDRDSSSEEYVTEIHITYPPGMLPITYTWGYQELEPGRPTFNQWSYLETVSWWEQDTVNGGVHSGESMEFWVTVSTSDQLPPGAEGFIGWRIEGNQSGVAEGLVKVETPVDAQSWSRIKSLYR
jgi:hypothetical protein